MIPKSGNRFSEKIMHQPRNVSSGGEMRVFRHKFDRIAVGIGGAEILGMVDENARRGLPGVTGGEFDAGLARNMQRFETRSVYVCAWQACGQCHR